MISEKLSAFYTKAEDKYFDVLDFLDGKGIPVYKYSDFFEQKGIPSFVVTIALLLILLIVLSLFFATQNGATNEILLSMRDSSGNALSNVKITLTDAQGNVINNINGLAKNDGSTLQIPTFNQGTHLKLTAAKDGYQPVSADLVLGKDKVTTQLLFESDFVGIPANIILIDSETKTKVTNAVVLVTWDTQSYQFYADTNGIYTKDGVPQNTTVLLKVKADGYTDLTQEVTFPDSTPKTFLINPSTASFVGKASVLVSVIDEAGNSIENGKVTIYKQSTGDILLQDYTKQGSVSGTIESGLALRITVEKEGYLTFDTDREGGAYTIRKSEDKIDVVLKQGGNKLTVIARDSLTGLALDNSVIQLYTLDGERITRQVAGVTGTDFTGLNPADHILITAFHDDYLPAQKQILVGATESEELLLAKTTVANAFRLDIYSIDEKGDSVGGAKITVKQFAADGNKLPYGLDDLAANIAGYVNANVAKGSTYEITSETDTLIGTTFVEVSDALKDNKVYVKLTKRANILEMDFKDPRGGRIIGTARVDALDGSHLYDGNINDSRIFFDAAGRETVEVSVILPDGNLFTENVYVKGKDTVSVVVYNQGSDALAPLIEFVGLESETGSTVQGITPNQFYWATFNVVFPIAATSGGVHMRAGDDTKTEVDSGNLALFELSMQGATNYYGLTYTPTPTPGNETADRANIGAMDSPNKWIEGVTQIPTGNYIVKVKLRASEFSAGRVQLHYRAWASVGDNYYRTPSDAVLTTSAVSDARSGLYAETSVQEITLYESLPECSDTVCVTTNFVDDTEKVYPETAFEATQGKIYALEAEFTAEDSDYLQVVASSPSNVTFVGTQVGTFSFIQDNGVIDLNGGLGSYQGFSSVGTGSTSGSTTTAAQASTTLSLTKGTKQKVRFYFKASDIGAAEIKLSATGNASIEKNVSFKVVKENQLLVEINPATVLMGRNFTVRVTDEGLKGVENALVKILDKDGHVVKSLAGDGSDGKGSSGDYRIQNDMGIGLYTVEVSVPTFATKAIPLLITTQDVWVFPEELTARIPQGQKTTLVTAELDNQSEFSISNITYETSTSDNFKVLVLAPPVLGNSQKQSVQVKVDYLGDLNSTADETITITIKGMVEGKFYTQLTSTLAATYNKKADASCLKIEPSSVIINLVGNQGATDSEALLVTNNCEQDVFLRAIPIEKTKHSGILISADDIALGVGETKNISVTANNGYDRQYGRDATFSFEILYDSNYLTKRVPITVRLINPLVALAYPAQITLFLAQSDPKGKAVAAEPIYVTNTSDFPVDGINFSVEKQYATGSNVQLTVEPPGAINLDPKQSMNPPKIAFAQASSTISEPVQAQITINGQMGNLNTQGKDNYNYYDQYYNNYTTSAGKTQIPTTYYAPKSISTGYTKAATALGLINVIIYYSGYDCLKAYPMDDLTFNLSLEGAQIVKRIKIQNTCAEPVQITGVTTPTANRQLFFAVPAVLIPNDGSETVVNLAVASISPTLKLENYPIQVQGITSISQTPIQSDKLHINLYSGQSVITEGKAQKGISVSVCAPTGGTETEKKSINVPKIASGTDCANGYCDAQQAAEYIAAQISQSIRTAQAKAYSNQQQDSAVSCVGRGFCTFGELGIPKQSFDLYLQNDSISAPIMENVLNKATQYNTGFNNDIQGNFRVELADVGTNVAEFIAMSGYGRTIIVDRGLEGCGYYKLGIDGAFNASGGQVQWELPTVVVSSNVGGAKKVITKECSDSIENVANFTPIDKGLTLSDNQSTWLTSVEGDSLLSDVGKKLAKNQFGSDARYGSGSGNKVVLKQGALTNALAEMCLSTGSGTKVINVTVNSTVASMTGTEKEKITTQVSTMVQNALTGNFGDNCLLPSTTGYNCVRLTDVGNVGGLVMSVPDKTIHLGINTLASCSSGTVYSTVPETINFSITPGTKFAGISSVKVIDASSGAAKKSLAEFTAGKQTLDTAITLTENVDSATRKEHPFKKDVNLCIETITAGQAGATDLTKAAFQKDLEGSSFIVTAVDKSAGNATGTKDEDGTVTVHTAAIHPDDLIYLLANRKVAAKGVDSPYYATFTWKGDPIAIDSFDKYQQGLVSSGVVDTVQISSKEGLLQNGETTKLLADGKKSALTSYLTTCGTTSAICNGATTALLAISGVGLPAALLKGGQSLLLSPIVDCGIPLATVYEQDVRDVWTPADDMYKNLFLGLSHLPSWMLGDYFKELANGSKLEEKSFGATILAATGTKALFTVPPSVKAIREAKESAEVTVDGQKQTKKLEELTKGDEAAKKAITENTKTADTIVGIKGTKGTGNNTIEELIKRIDKQNTALTTFTTTPGTVKYDSTKLNLQLASDRLLVAKDKATQAQKALEAARTAKGADDKEIAKIRTTKLTEAENLLQQATNETKTAADIVKSAATNDAEPAHAVGKVLVPEQVNRQILNQSDAIGKVEEALVAGTKDISTAKEAVTKSKSLTEAAEKAAKLLSEGKTASALSITKNIAKLASPLLCSILANVAGTQSYNNAIDATTKTTYAKGTLFSDYPVEKDKTYKIVVKTGANGELIPSVTKVETADEIAAMNADLAIDPATNKSSGTTIYWDKATSNSDKPPYERTLTIYKMQNNIQQLNTLLKRCMKNANQNDTTAIIERIASPSAQQLIFDYTNPEGAFTLTSTDKRNVDEMMSAAVVAAFYDDIGEKGLAAELKTHEGVVKEKSLALLDMLKAENQYKFTRDSATALADGDARKADILYTVVNALYVKECGR